jgi:hypothetical protein
LVPSALGEQLGHPVSGGHKYGGLVLQVGGLGAGLTIQPCIKVIVKKPQRGGHGTNWAVEPFDYGVLIVGFVDSRREDSDPKSKGICRI